MVRLCHSPFLRWSKAVLPSSKSAGTVFKGYRRPNIEIEILQVLRDEVSVPQTLGQARRSKGLIEGCQAPSSSSSSLAIAPEKDSCDKLS